LREKYDLKVASSLLPIILGVCLSSVVEVEVRLISLKAPYHVLINELQFNWLGLLTALASTALFVCQNLYSKVLFRDGTIDHVSLLEHTSLLAAALLFPIWLIVEGPYVIGMADKMVRIRLPHACCAVHAPLGLTVL
jgi:hypothetical protein